MGCNLVSREFEHHEFVSRSMAALRRADETGPLQPEAFTLTWRRHQMAS